MIRLLRPDDEAIARWLARADPGFSHPDVGATARADSPDVVADLSRRYTVDRRRFPLGSGRARFERARDALFAWRGFEIPWLTLHGATEPVHAGQIVATRTRAFGLWFANPCRVVDREERSAGARSAGGGRPDGANAADAFDVAAFAYGTLPGHVAHGEERFSVRHDPSTDAVEFEIFAFSRPAIALTRLGYPLVRRIQRRFAADAAAALRRAIGD